MRTLRPRPDKYHDSGHAGRHGVLALAAALACALALGGCGDKTAPTPNGAGWRATTKELRIAVAGLSQTAPEQTTQVTRLQQYLQKATGLTVRVNRVSDYNSVIQALASGQVDVAMMGAGAYANVHDQLGHLAAPALLMLGASGETGYYSALIVRSDSPYRSLADLKGKSLAVVDLNSTSGYLFPMHALRKEGIDAGKYFSRIGVTGGHAQSVIAVYNRQYDAAFVMAGGGTPQTGFALTAYSMMADKGLLPRDAVRDVWVVGPVPNETFVMRTDRPQAFIDLVRGALAALPYEEPGAWTGLGALPGLSLTASDDSTFADVFALHKEAIAAERAKATRGPK